MNRNRMAFGRWRTDRLHLAEGGREIVGAGLALAIEEGAPEGLFRSLLDLGPGIAFALRGETGWAH